MSKYKNITISGLTGVGASTLAKNLAKKLSWQYYSGGDFMRKYAIEQGLFDKNNKVHHDATIYSDEFDRQVDYQARKMLEKSTGNVVDAWLAGFMSQGIEGVLKVMVYCSDDAVRIDRIVNRDRIRINEAKTHVFEREAKNLNKWSRMYKKEWQEWVLSNYPELAKREIYFWYPEMYDLVLDTYKLGPEETLQAVLDRLN